MASTVVGMEALTVSGRVLIGSGAFSADDSATLAFDVPIDPHTLLANVACCHYLAALRRRDGLP